MQEYQYFLTRSRRRSLSVSISDEGKIIVKAPLLTTQNQVEEFLLSKKDWILKHLDKIAAQKEAAVQAGILTEEEIKELKKKAKIIFPHRVAYYANIMGVTYGRISIRCQKTRWGSCSAEGNLNFNYLLCLMPIEILDSVVVHELAHRRHMNHSRAFYEEIEKVFPEYKKCNRWLKQNGGSYTNRLPK